MFTHILIPTDGSQRSEAAIHEGIKFAKDAHAKVTGFHVVPQFHVFTYKTELLEETRGHFAKESRAHPEQYLGVIEKAAKEAGVACDTAYLTHDHPYEAIIETAEKNGCDHLDGFARPTRGAGRTARQRDTEGPDPQQNTGAGLPLSLTTFEALKEALDMEQG
jgi:hypothetical protein